MSSSRLKILMIAEDASAIFGGEAMLALHYFRRLRARGVDVRLLTHARNRDPLLAMLPEESGRIDFAPDSFLHRLLWQVGRRLPVAAGRVVTGPLMKFLSQCHFRRIAKRIIDEKAIDLVHQPAPVSPKDLCMLFGLGVPVVIGPLNGGMSYPPGFQHLEGKTGRASVALGRWCSGMLHLIFPGKLHADLVLVANDRTRRALPKGMRGRIIELVENGVDLSLWSRRPRRNASAVTRFVFSGRLVRLKGLDYLLRALAIVKSEVCASLDILGDGEERLRLEGLAAELRLRDSVKFHGWVDQARIAAQLATTDVFVMPTLRECGGAVVLEAMAAGVPVIATRWGGPADYLDDTCALLVEPSNEIEFVRNLANAMVRLARDPRLRQTLAAESLARVRNNFDWEKKIDQMLLLYEQTAHSVAHNAAPDEPLRVTCA